MKLEKLLAENMLRFGTKNLRVEHVASYLLEQTKVPEAIYRVYATQGTVAQLPSIMKTYDPTKGAIKIIDGNPWLATQRATALQQFLIQRFQGSFTIPFDAASAKITETVVKGTGDANQYMKATIKAKLTKLAKTQGAYNYELLYNFYDINGVPHVLVTKNTKGAPLIANSPADTDAGMINRFKKFVDAIPGSFLVKQGGNTAPTANGAEFGIMFPITTGFTAKKKGRLYFDNVKQYDAMKNFITSITDISSPSGTPIETGDLKTRTKLRIGFTSEKGGGGNYIFGNLLTGRKSKIVYGPGTGTDITIKRMEPSIQGNLPGEILPGQEEKWWPIAEIIYPGLFPDNLITIKPDMYKEIFDKIQIQIDELTTQEYTAIEMTAEIQGFASTDAANNRCPRGFKPDHTWGGAVTADKWITL